MPRVGARIMPVPLHCVTKRHWPGNRACEVPGAVQRNSALSGPPRQKRPAPLIFFGEAQSEAHQRGVVTGRRPERGREGPPQPGRWRARRRAGEPRWPPRLRRGGPGAAEHGEEDAPNTYRRPQAPPRPSGMGDTGKEEPEPRGRWRFPEPYQRQRDNGVRGGAPSGVVQCQSIVTETMGVPDSGGKAAVPDPAVGFPAEDVLLCALRSLLRPSTRALV